MLDERSLRRPTLDEANSHPVTMGDGQQWLLPKPFVNTRPRNRPVFRGGRAESVVVATDDPEFNALVKTIEEEDTYLSIANLAAYLLLKNYDLTDDQLAEVLEYDPADDSPDRWALQVLAHAYGRTGKKA